MNRLAQQLLAVSIGFSGLLTVLRPQDSIPQDQRGTELVVPPPVAGQAGLRDPFAPSERMLEGIQDPSGFVPQDLLTALPELTLRGYAEDDEGRSFALLEVDGVNTFLVHKDDTLSLPRGRENLVMRIVDVTQRELRVEFGQLRRVVVVR